MFEQLLFPPEELVERQPVSDLVSRLREKCRACELSLLAVNRAAPGLFWEGSLESADIAFLADQPQPACWVLGKFLAGHGREELERWLRLLDISFERCAGLYLIQCHSARREGRTHRQVDPSEQVLSACFPARALKVLQAMPGLRAVVTLGELAARTLLGTRQLFKHLEGCWCGHDLLPGVAIYCLPHPAEVSVNDMGKRGSELREFLRNFRREYLETGRVLEVLKESEKARKDMRCRT